MKTSFYFYLTLAFCLARMSFGGSLTEADLKKVGFDQHIGQQISRNLVFQDAQKQRVTMGELFNNKPTLLVLGYYHCPMLCTLINDGMIESLQELRLNIGRDFNVINVSIDPTETPEVAAAKKKEYLRRYGRPGAEERWFFLTGAKEEIAQLTNEAGFRYRYDSETHEYAHPSGFIVLTPEGEISRYFFGVNFEPKEVRSAIIAASKSERGSVIHELVLLCCRYNPITGKYGTAILYVMRAAGLGTVLLLAWWIIRACRSEPREPEPEAS